MHAALASSDRMRLVHEKMEQLTHSSVLLASSGPFHGRTDGESLEIGGDENTLVAR